MDIIESNETLVVEGTDNNKNVLVRGNLVGNSSAVLHGNVKLDGGQIDFAGVISGDVKIVHGTVKELNVGRYVYVNPDFEFDETGVSGTIIRKNDEARPFNLHRLG